MEHWVNAVAMVLMIMSGWQVYNASPLFDFTFSKTITCGGWLGGALLWHFAAMWLLMVNGLVYLGLATAASEETAADHAGGRDRRYQGGCADRQDVDGYLTKSNYVQKPRLCRHHRGLGILIVLSGLAIWKPVQLQ